MPPHCGSLTTSVSEENNIHCIHSWNKVRAPKHFHILVKWSTLRSSCRAIGYTNGHAQSEHRRHDAKHTNPSEPADFGECLQRCAHSDDHSGDHYENYCTYTVPVCGWFDLIIKENRFPRKSNGTHWDIAFRAIDTLSMVEPTPVIIWSWWYYP